MTTKADIVIQQGAKFTKNVQVLNNDMSIFDLSGYSARMQIRETLNSVDVLLEASSSDGRITINAPGGVIMINIGADVTEALTWTNGVYDLEIYKADPAEVIRILQGNASLSWGVTR